MTDSDTEKVAGGASIQLIIAGWAQKNNARSNSKFSLECAKMLRTLFEEGRKDKSHQYSADRAHQKIINELLHSDWEAKLHVTVAKIKVFFQMTPGKMKKLVDELEKKRNDEIFDEEELAQIEAFEIKDLEEEEEDLE